MATKVVEQKRREMEILRCADQMGYAIESVAHTLGQVPQPYPPGYVSGMIAELLASERAYLDACGRPGLTRRDYGSRPEWMPLEHWTWLRERCACCRKFVKEDQIAASKQIGTVLQVWCFDCWDNDGRAIDQYNGEMAVPI